MRSVPVSVLVTDESTGETTLSSDNNGLLTAASVNRQRLSVARGFPLRKSASQQSLSQQSSILKVVGEKIRKTKAGLDRSGLIHAFYILALVVYSVLGGFLFSLLDGPASDKILAEHKFRCVERKEQMWTDLIGNCSDFSFVDCLNRSRAVLDFLDACLRKEEPQITIHSTAIYSNSLIYSITVFTTIGYGTIMMSSPAGRVATIVYTLLGTPLFFAFLNDIGQWFQRMFLKAYYSLRRFLKNHRAWTIFWGKKLPFRNRSKTSVDSELCNNNTSTGLCSPEGPSKPGLIFTCAVMFLIFYFVFVSFTFCLIENWLFFDSFYFLFQSIALIGFGDVFPARPFTLLFTILFIIIGISLLSMCFFILQEWIREKTSRLSRKVRSSVRQWRTTHAFINSNRNLIIRSLRYHHNHDASDNNNGSLRNGNCVSNSISFNGDNNDKTKNACPLRRCSSTDGALPNVKRVSLGKVDIFDENNKEKTTSVISDDRDFHIADISAQHCLQKTQSAANFGTSRKRITPFRRAQTSGKFYGGNVKKPPKKIVRITGKRNSLGKPVIAAGRFQFMPSNNEKDDDSCLSDGVSDCS